MTPRLAIRRLATRPPAHLDAPRDVLRDSGPWRWLAIGLLAAGVAIGAVLVVVGQAAPPLGPVLVLALFVAVAVNRFALFPTELAVTAEAAVLVAAIVVFAVIPSGAGGGSSALLGPWCVALLAGPLDVAHLRRRSYVRMAYNSGSRMISTVAGATAFSAVVDHAGTSRVAIAAAALSASLAFVVAECTAGIVLVRLRNLEPWSAAARIEIPLESLGVPVGIVGAGAGYLAVEVGWWAAALVLTPTLFVPELALVWWRKARAIANLAVTVAPVVACAVGLALMLPVPSAATVGTLVCVALVFGFELRADEPVPPLVATLVAAAVVVSGEAVLMGAFLVAAVATATAWLVAGARSWWAPLIAGAGAMAAGMVYDVWPTRSGALLTAVLFAAVAVRWSRILWNIPFVCVGVSSAMVWREIGPGGAAVFCSAVAVTLVAAAAFGTPPWGSRVVGAWAFRHLWGSQRAMLVALAAPAAILGCAARTALDIRDVLAAGAAVAVTAVAAVATTAVRQWRFAPSARIRDASMSLAAAVTATIAYPPMAIDSVGSGLVLLGVALAAVVAIAWPLGRLAATASGHTRQARRETSSR